MIVESRGKWGIQITEGEERLLEVRSGDIIEFPEELIKYPVSQSFCRVQEIHENGRVHIVDGMGSAFLSQNGSVNISGGPFFSVWKEHLIPCKRTHPATYWNWGNNFPGANQGVYYQLARPVFLATRHPKDFTSRIGADEDSARNRDHFRNSCIPPEAVLYKVFPWKEGLSEYWFDLKGTK